MILKFWWSTWHKDLELVSYIQCNMHWILSVEGRGATTIYTIISTILSQTCGHSPMKYALTCIWCSYHYDVIQPVAICQVHVIWVLLHVTCYMFYCFAGEIKTLMIQLLRAVAHLHDNWILHRDLKASNLLLSNKGILKVRHSFTVSKWKKLWILLVKVLWK